MKDFIKAQQEENKKILELISKYLENTDLRFGQVLHILRLTDINFYEEPNHTLERLSKLFKPKN